jgi:oligoendopeptidase F
MSQPTVRTRADIPAQYKWNSASLFQSDEAWAQAAAELSVWIHRLEGYRGRLAESPQVLLETLGVFQEAVRLGGKIQVYADMSHSADKSDPTAAGLEGRAVGLVGELKGAGAFIEPELVQIGWETLKTWMDQEPGLEAYAHSFDDLFRKQTHVRSADVEQLLGMLAAPFQGAGNTASVLTDADLRFPPARSKDGADVPLTSGTVMSLLSNPDREVRRTAWENYHDAHLTFKNTLASSLNTSIQQNVFLMKARGYASTLEATLFQDNIPVEVFHNLVETFKRHLPLWQRYFAVRRKALGVEKLYPYDMWAPLTPTRQAIPFEQAVDWIVAALEPMGEEYTRTIRRGVFEEGWVDVYPSPGKHAGAFSHGSPGTHPFIMMNYAGTVFSLGTLAHELGHSMHSYLTWQNQPVIYSDYTSFVAEVASNFHQAMLRAYLLETQKDPAFQTAVLEEAMANFYRYFFLMPTLARFELDMHERAERGEGLTAETMITAMADLFAEGYGEQVEYNRDRVGSIWSTFGHLYSDYYVFQYATGISGANALSRGVLEGRPGAVERYLGFLKLGSSEYPLQALQAAGVDLTSPQPVEDAFHVMEGYVDRLEALCGGA